ncbi:MAG: hypothetical protein KDK91_30540 [Gammaproteobacteria bacterium]|nr:hypothetical protein [Gammaproteobacteria bacterium]
MTTRPEKTIRRAVRGLTLSALAALPILAAAPSQAQRSTPVTVVNNVSEPVPVSGQVEAIAQPDLTATIPVTLSQRVNPDNAPEDRSGETTITLKICIGTQPCTTSDAALADRLRSGSSEVLVVTGVTAYNFGSPAVPDDSYGLLNFGACRSGGFPRQFGVPIFTTDGRGTTGISLRPGAIVSDLEANERLCFTSFAQSTHLVDVTLHGFLIMRP